MKDFLQALQTQRWDDHRYYHHDRINQSLHLLSALAFVVAYVWLLIDPVVSALIAWLVSMTSRQAGHFFFEPHDYDQVNDATHQYKEEIKVGYNLRRKVVLMGIWAASPLVLWLAPDLFGLITPHTDWLGFAHHVGASWLVLGVAGLLLRAFQLVRQQDSRTGLGHQDPDRPVSRYLAVPQGAAASDARPAHGPDGPCARTRRLIQPRWRSASVSTLRRIPRLV